MVFKVDVQATEDGLVVTCADVPALRERIGSLWDACSVRTVLARLEGVPEDLVWLQIRSHTGSVTVVSDVHPLHWVAFHTVVRPAHPVFDRTTVLFDHAVAALRHEAEHDEREGRFHARVKIILSFLDGSKTHLPRSGGYDMREVTHEIRDTGHFDRWLQGQFTEETAPAPGWYVPVIGVQIGVFAPEVTGARRYR